MVPDGATLVIGGLIENERRLRPAGPAGPEPAADPRGGVRPEEQELGEARAGRAADAAHLAARTCRRCRPPHGGIAPGRPDRRPAGRDGRPPRRGARPAAAGRHVVREGEDLWSIAKQHYGSGRHYQAIWDANRDRITSPESIPAGTELAAAGGLPELAPPALRRGRAPAPARRGRVAGRRASRPRRPASDPADAAAAVARGRGPPARPAGATPTAARRSTAPRRPTSPDGDDDAYPVHVVGRFESLRSIARDRLGDSRRAARSSRLNRDTLRTSDRPVPGQHLRLPGTPRRPPRR